MTRALMEGFMGEMPILSPGTLKPNQASETYDVKIEGGNLKSLREDLFVAAKTTASPLLSLYLYNSQWFEWETDVDAVKSQIGADAYDRVLFTGDGAPKVTYSAIATSGGQPFPSNSYLLGTPPPGYVSGSFPFGQALTGNVTGTPDDVNDLVDTRFYVATSVDIFGAEGPPCLVSPAFEWQPGQTVNIDIPSAPVGNYNITGWRLYRTSTGSASTDFLYVKEGSTWSASTADTPAAEQHSEGLTTEDYNLPHPSMIGITAMPGSFLAGHYDNILFFSEPGYPHAWPIAYQLNTKKPIVGIEVVAQNMLLVATEDRPYIAIGTDPANMSLSSLDDILQACVSKRSILDVGSSVVYASPDGLMSVSTKGSVLVTESVFSADQWEAMNPASMECHLYEGVAMVVWENYTAGTQGAFFINPAVPEAGIVRLSGRPDGSYHDALTDRLYISIGGDIKVFDGDTTYRTGTWTSKLMEFLSPLRFSCGRAWGNEVGNVMVSMLDKTNEYFSRVVRGENPFRLKGGQKFRSARAKLTLSGGAEIHRLELAETMPELRGS